MDKRLEQLMKTLQTDGDIVYLDYNIEKAESVAIVSKIDSIEIDKTRISIVIKNENSYRTTFRAKIEEFDVSIFVGEDALQKANKVLKRIKENDSKTNEYFKKLFEV